MKNKKQWIGIGVTVTGNGHITDGTPCQDAHYTGNINKNWQIAVVSDGAGSYSNSHLGSAFVTEQAIRVFTELIRDELWLKEKWIPSATLWRDVALTGFSLLYDMLKNYANELGLPVKSLSSTIILAIYNENGVLSAHIGDGRAAMLTVEGEWVSIIQPFAGQEVGSTVFLTTSEIWQNPARFIETRRYERDITVLTLLTDGLERYCYYCYAESLDTGKYFDPNLPFKSFFDQNIQAIRKLYEQGKSTGEISEMFSRYLESGHPEIAKEYDDKTIIISMLT